MSASIWDGASGGVIEVVDADNTYLQQQYTSVTEGQTLFVLTSFNYAVGTNSLRVYVNGTRQVVGRDYLETNSSSFTFVSGLQSEDIVDAEGIVGTEGAQNAIEVAEAAAAAAQAALDAINNLALPSLPLTISNGGTGQVTKAAGFLALAPVPVANTVIGSLDGSTYQTIPIGLTQGVDIITSVNLTAATMGYHMVAMTAQGGSISLPSALTLLVGAPRAIIDNTKGTYPVAVRNYNDQLLTGVSAGGIAFLGLKNNSTDSGVWSVLGDGLEPGFISADATLSASFNSFAYAASIAFTNSVSAHFVGSAISNGFSAFVVDQLSKVVSAPAPLSIVTSARVAQCFRISATQGIMFHGTGSSYSASVVTLTGTTPNFSISASAAATIAVSTGSAWGGENAVDVPKIIQLSTLLYLATYISAGAVFAVVISVSGTTVTIGTPLNVGAATTANDCTLLGMTGTTAICHFKIDAGTNYVALLTVSGTNVTTPGTVTLTLGSPVPTFSCSLALSSTKALVIDDTTTSLGVAFLVTVSGSTLTVAAPVTIINGGVVGKFGYSGEGSNRFTPRLYTLNSTTAVFWSALNGQQRTMHWIITENAGVLTIGSPNYGIASETYSSSSPFYGRLLPASGDIISSIMQDNELGTKKKVTTNKIVGNNIIPGYSASLPELIPGSSLSDMATKLFSGDNLITSPVATSAISVIKSNGVHINYRGSIKIPRAISSPLFPLAVGPTRAVYLYSAQALSHTATQLRVLNVEIAL